MLAERARARRGLGVPIRYALPVAFAVLILLTVGVELWLSYSASLRSARAMAGQMSAQTADQVNQDVALYLGRPQEYLQVNLAAYHSGGLDLSNFDQLARFFWRQTQITSSVRYIYYATAGGNFLGTGTDPIEGPILEIRDDKTAPIRLSYRLDSNGDRVGEPSREEYDPRTRPWYQAAIAANGPSWSPVYSAVGIGAGELTMTAVVPVADNQGRVQGVLGSDLTLSDLTDFLRSIKPSEHGGAFIIERDGLLVATSSSEDPYKTTPGGDQQDRLNVLESSDPLTKGTGQYLKDTLGSFDQISFENDPTTNQPRPRSIDFQLGGRNQLGQVFAIEDGRGLDWLMVVVAPAEDFMGGWNDQMSRTLAIGLAVLGIAVALGYVIGRWILEPVTTMSRVAEAIEKDRYELEPLDRVAERSDELGHLARVFRRMATEVYAREQQLRHQVEQLKVEIDEVKRNAQVKAITDSEAFNSVLERARRLRQEKSMRQETRASLTPLGSQSQLLDQEAEGEPGAGGEETPSRP
jgi:HAMP domain-containing protein